MLLSISGRSANQNLVEVHFESTVLTKTFTSKYFPSPLSAPTRRRFAEYFAGDEPDPKCAERLIRLGENIGERVHGEGLEMSLCREVIERVGYEQLDVRIEADYPAFFAEHWELMVLPASKYVLAANCKAFSRHYLGGETSRSADASGPVRSGRTMFVAHVVGRPQPDALHVVANTFKALAFAAETRIEIADVTGLDALANWLGHRNRDLHVFHYDGPVQFREGEAYLCIGTAWTSVRALAALLQTHRIPVLSLDTRLDRAADAPIEAAVALASIARQIGAITDVSIVGLNYSTNPWDASRCFQAIFSALARGLPVSLAVVEARKSLQANLKSCALSVRTTDFHLWGLPVHYGSDRCAILPSGEADAEPTRGVQAVIGQKMFGFRSRYFEPMTTHIADSSLLPVLRFDDDGCVDLLAGEPGAGKTHALHQAALYACCVDRSAFAFYFDYAREFYAADDIVRMIGPVLGTADDLEKTRGRLAETRCCFAFDNVPRAIAVDLAGSDLARFFSGLRESGHVVLLVGGAGGIGAVRHHEVSLTQAEQRALFCDRHKAALQHRKVDRAAGDPRALLDVAAGNAYLLERLAAVAARVGQAQVEAECREMRSASGGDASVEGFLDFHWHRLDFDLHRFMLSMTEHAGVLLEMLAVVIDRIDPDTNARSFPAAERLFPSSRRGDLRLGTELDALEACGFLERTTQGRVMAHTALAFLDTKKPPREPGGDDAAPRADAMDLHRVICESLRLLSPQIRAKMNPPLLNYLVNHRAQWAVSLEALWDGCDFDAFFGTKSELDWLLSQARLLPESHLWATALLARTDPSSERRGSNAAMAWAALAGTVLAHHEGAAAALPARAADYFSVVVDRFLDGRPDDEDSRALFQHASTFLESLYMKRAQWSECARLSERLRDMYAGLHDVAHVLRSLRTLSRCAFESKDPARGERLEKEMLSLVMDKDSAAADPVVMRLVLDCLTAKINRGDGSGAQALLDDITGLFDRNGAARILLPYQADVHFLAGRHAEAAEAYGALLKNAPDRRAHMMLDPAFNERLESLEQHLGRERLRQLMGSPDNDAEAVAH